ncbi:uncharacterized protein DS421_13g413690 [Arachis hypogaea]|nr:uncharacterized protein DS421_13g413690 [Arachis hypogaea]
MTRFPLSPSANSDLKTCSCYPISFPISNSHKVSFSWKERNSEQAGGGEKEARLVAVELEGELSAAPWHCRHHATPRRELPNRAIAVPWSHRRAAAREDAGPSLPSRRKRERELANQEDRPMPHRRQARAAAVPLSFCRCSRRCYRRREPWLEEGARDQGRGVSRFASVESALLPPLLGFHRRRPRGGWCRHKRRPPELLSASASGLCKLLEPTAARAAQNHHCGCRWDCERKKETLVLSQPFPGEKSVAPPCLAAGKCHCRRPCCRLRWLPGCRQTGSETVAIRFSHSPSVLGCISMLACRARSSRLLRFASSLGAEVAVVGDPGLGEEVPVTFLGYGIAF